MGLVQGKRRVEIEPPRPVAKFPIGTIVPDEEVAAQGERAGYRCAQTSILVGHASPFRFGSDRFYRHASPPTGA